MLAEPADKCLLELNSGDPCEEDDITEPIKKWYFSSDTMTCEPFMYTGCGGNENMFDDLKSCGHSCKLLFSVPADECVISFNTFSTIFQYIMTVSYTY